MKVVLLKKLRRRGRNQIHIITTRIEVGFDDERTVIGMKYSFSDDAYSGLFDFGDTKADVYKKAERIYIEDYLKRKRA